MYIGICTKFFNPQKDFCFDKISFILLTAATTETPATRKYDIPMLSGSAYVGQLYDATKDQLLFDRFLWDTTDGIAVNEANITSVETETYIEESISDRYNHLGISAQISASMFSGLVKVNDTAMGFFFPKLIQGVSHLRGFHYRGSHYCGFWLMYAKVGDFRVSRGPSTVPLTRILCNAVFFKSQIPRKVGTLCIA